MVGRDTYEPLNTLKAVAPDLWVVDGPLIRFGPWRSPRSLWTRWNGGQGTHVNFMTEVVFFHHRTRTLILTDFIENFEPAKTASWLMRCLTRIGGVRDPDGGMPRDMRLSFREHRPAPRTAVERMIAWNPERIILAHGRWYTRAGTYELRRAFRWLLE